MPEADTEIDLVDVIDAKLYADSRCFDSIRYAEWEREVATPALEALGYTVTGWETTDGDSFGPLVRKVTVEKDGKRAEFWHA